MVLRRCVRSRLKERQWARGATGEGAATSVFDWLGGEGAYCVALSAAMAAGSLEEPSKAFGSTASAAMRASAEMTSVHVLPGTSREDEVPSLVWTSSLPTSCSPSPIRALQSAGLRRSPPTPTVLFAARTCSRENGLVGTPCHDVVGERDACDCVVGPQEAMGSLKRRPRRR